MVDAPLLNNPRRHVEIDLRQSCLIEALAVGVLRTAALALDR
jgi:hypothetical protein